LHQKTKNGQIFFLFNFLPKRPRQRFNLYIFICYIFSMAFPPGQPGQLPVPNFPKGPPQQNPLNIPPMPANRLVNPNTFITQPPSQQISQAQLNQALGGQNAIPVANQQFMHGGMQINPQLILQQQQQRTGMPMQGSPNQPPMQVGFFYR
jgi:hypothetical protein